jgi:hypothetical protein
MISRRSRHGIQGQGGRRLGSDVGGLVRVVYLGCRRLAAPLRPACYAKRVGFPLASYADSFRLISGYIALHLR